MQLPTALRDRLLDDLGEKEASALFSALALSPCRALRYDPEKVSHDALSAALSEGLGEKVPFLPFAHYFSHEAIGSLALHHGGAIYVQDAAAMAPVAALGEEKAHAILDLCAAPGGKSLQALSLLDEGGVLVSNEPNPARRKALMQNLERAGVKQCLVTDCDGTSLPKDWEGAFDLVLCDAPCSGEGMLRKEPGVAELWSPERVGELAAIQRELLEQAARVLCEGGRLLYATCTWSREENEDQLLAFLARHPEFSFELPSQAVAKHATPTENGFCLRFYPHRFRGEGQFCAVLRKRTSGTPRPFQLPSPSKKPHPDEKTVRAFLADTLTEIPPWALLCRGEFWFLCPPSPIPTDGVAAPGVCIGSVQKGRVVPHHRFFLAFAAHFRRRITLPLSDGRITAYLRGEELAIEAEAGWSVLFADACPLGGVKLSGNRAKNHYPKGLRRP